MTNGRILIIDDHPLMRKGLSLAISEAAPGSIIDQAGSIFEAEGLIARYRFYKLAFLDFILPDAHGFSGLITLQSLLPDVPFVMISAIDDDDFVAAAKGLGAAGYLSKVEPLAEFAKDVRRVLTGERIFPSEVAPCSEIRDACKGFGLLSAAQMRVLIALGNGRLNKQIAGDLHLTEATVKAHLSAIFRKLGVLNRTQAIVAMQPLLGSLASRDENISWQ